VAEGQDLSDIIRRVEEIECAASANAPLSLQASSRDGAALDQFEQS